MVIINLCKLLKIEMKFCMCVCRPQQGFRDFRGTFSVMEARILYWMVSGEDVFYPSSGVCHFPLVRQEDAPFEVRFLIPPRPVHVWEDEADDD
jgi:hypothetical protein